MARDVICPTCNGDLLLSGEEKSGEDVFCPTCESPCVVRIGESGDPEVDADF